MNKEARKGLHGLWLLALLVCSMSGNEVEAKGSEPKKNGAGLLFITPSGKVLLLLRAGKHNAGKWGLPGGNMEEGDADLLATAKREAAEELGGEAALPAYTVVGEGILTMRGKAGKKHFTVYVAKVSEDAAASYKASNLNTEEHSDYKWFDLDELEALAAEDKLHPVIKKLIRHHKDDIIKISGAAADAGTAATGIVDAGAGAKAVAGASADAKP